MTDIPEDKPLKNYHVMKCELIPAHRNSPAHYKLTLINWTDLNAPNRIVIFSASVGPANIINILTKDGVDCSKIDKRDPDAEAIVI